MLIESGVHKSQKQWSCLECPACKDCLMCPISESRLRGTKPDSICLTFDRGTEIMGTSRTPNGVYCLRSGIVRMVRLTTDGGSVTYGFRTSGEIIGHTAILDRPSPFSIQSVTSVDACFFPITQFLAAVRENPVLMERIAGLLADELEELVVQLGNTVTLKVEQRVAHAILSLSDRFGVDEDGFINLPLTRKELSGIVGASIEAVFRALAFLKKEGAIIVGKERIAVIRKDILHAIQP